MRRFALVAATLAGCQQYGLHAPGGEVDHGTPRIEVEPSSLTFDPTSPGDPTTLPLTVSNTGGATLSVSSISLVGSTAFEIDPTPFTVAAGAQVDVDVTFDPADLDEEATVTFASDDPVDPEVPIPLSGQALLPQLTIDPATYDFGFVGEDCPITAKISLESTGTAAVQVTGVVEKGAGFTIVDPPTMPLTIPPGYAYALTVEVDGSVDQTAYDGTLEVADDEPAGERTATQTAEAPTLQEDDFTATGGADQTDVIVYSDAPDFGDWKGTLSGDLDELGDALGAVVADWQLIVVTQSSGCPDGDVITPSTPNIGQAMYHDILYGSDTDDGFSAFVAAIDKGGKSTGCDAGFLRPDASLVLLVISDEDGYGAVKKVTAVAPDVPIDVVLGDGCDSQYYPEPVYAGAAAATGGVELTFCEDWGSELDLVAAHALAGAGRFVLSGEPDPGTITVTVDGAADARWTWNAKSNAVVMDDDAIPPPGASVVVTWYPAVC